MIADVLEFSLLTVTRFCFPQGMQKAGTRAHTVPKFYLRGFVDPESESRSGPVDPFVWLGSLTTDEIKRRSPKNISIVRGLYDGPGGFADSSASIEAHLAKIEGAAAVAIANL